MRPAPLTGGCSAPRAGMTRRWMTRPRRPRPPAGVSGRASPMGGRAAGRGPPAAAMTSCFAAMRVRPASRHSAREADRSLPACWLLAEWPPEADEPTDYWLSNLPEDTPIEELARLAKIRWRIEHDYRELKTGL